MNVKPDPKVLEEASRWYARLLAPDCGIEERARFNAWHSQPANARAFALATKLAEMLPRFANHPRVQTLAAQALREEAPATAVVQDLAASRKLPPRLAVRRWTLPASLAAALAVVLVGAQVLTQRPAPSTESVATFETSADKRQAFTLEDGTLVEVDVASRLSVTLTATAREVELLSGRAIFSVAHDPDRPFGVRAGATRTVALGTQFQVQRRDDAVLITLAEGSVRVSGGTPSASWSEMLVPGEQITLDAPASGPRKIEVDPGQVTSWSRGRLVFRGTPLAEAVEEINRYAPIKVRIADPALADLKVGGNFIAGDGRPIVSAFAAVLPLTIVDSGDEFLLYRRDDAGS